MKQVKKGLLSTTKKGLLYQSSSPKLTKAEEEILLLLTDKFLTPIQISYRRKCSKQAVYRIIRNLKKKGVFNLGIKKVYFKQPTTLTPPKSKPKDHIRLHGQEFNIRILYKDEKYKKIRNKSNIITIDGNTIRLYTDSIEIYSGQSFFAENSQKATAKSLDYWNRFFARLEHEFKTILSKPRSQNIKLVNQHYAYMDSEITESAMEKKEHIKIYTKDDGKLWFLTDNSFGFKEDETVHSKTAKQDREKVDKQVNDWRDNNPPTNSEIWELSKQNTQNQAEITSNQLLDAKNIIKHQKVLDEMLKTMKSIQEGLKKKTFKEWITNKLKSDNQPI